MLALLSQRSGLVQLFLWSRLSTQWKRIHLSLYVSLWQQNSSLKGFIIPSYSNNQFVCLILNIFIKPWITIISRKWFLFSDQWSTFEGWSSQSLCKSSVHPRTLPTSSKHLHVWLLLGLPGSTLWKRQELDLRIFVINYWICWRRRYKFL